MTINANHLFAAVAIFAVGYIVGRHSAATVAHVQAGDVAGGGMWTWNGQ